LIGAHGSLAIFCADIGSVAKNNFGWAGLLDQPEHRNLVSGPDIAELADIVAERLDSRVPVALGFECPLFVPISQDPARLTSARIGEGRRAWAAGGGSGALATGLTETVWILRRVRERLSSQVRAHTKAHIEWPPFANAGEGLFLWEAFVSDAGKGQSTTHAGDAEIAVQRFMESLPDPDASDAITSDEEVHSLLGAALLRTGWMNDLAVLSKPCLVIKA
jgi:hypothetical protein